jgi:uncharacterized iron-regulated membrane protein
MRLVVASRKLHKWLMLFIGFQFVIWTISGAYMVIFDIDYIHGDSLVLNHQTKLNANALDYSIVQLYQDYPQAKHIELATWVDKEVYRFEANDQQFLISAKSGKLLSPLTKEQAIKTAKHAYAGQGEIKSAQLLTEQAPFELNPRFLPAWRINFNDSGNTSFYISAESGKLVTKRHQYWRMFDWMFSFHVMDYVNEEVDNQLLFWFTLLGLLAACAGAILTYYSFFKVTKRKVSL